MNKLLATALLLTLTSTAFAQYTNQTQNIYSSKEGNMYVKASYTSVNRSMADRTIYLNSRNANSRSKDMLTWTNGDFKDVRDFLKELIIGLDRGKDASFQIGYMHRASVMDANNLKVYHVSGGFSYFNKQHMFVLLQAIKDMK